MPQTHSSPFVHNFNTVNVVMIKVLTALIPAFSLWVYFYGWTSMIQFILCIITCYVLEWLVLTLRKKPLEIFLNDGSTMVTAVLIGFCIPPLAPWWLSVCTCIFAMLLGKHIYGGLGQNIFNPAMLGYAIALISFPVEFSLWQTSLVNQTFELSWADALNFIFFSQDSFNFSSATILAEWRKQPIPNDIDWFQQTSFYLNNAFLVGGFIILSLRVIRWHIPLGVLTGMITTIFLIHWNQELGDAILFHLFSGATAIGAFFIATDPVSSAATKQGQFYYALLIGILTVMIRTWGNFPEGIAFAVLIGNLCVPLLDYYLKPKW